MKNDIERLRKRNNLDKLISNMRMKMEVISDRKIVDNVERIESRIVNRDNIRKNIEREILKKRKENMERDIERDKSRKNGRRIRLILVDRIEGGINLGIIVRRRGNKMMWGRKMGDKRIELGIEKGEEVERELLKKIDDIVEDMVGMKKRKMIELKKIEMVVKKWDELKKKNIREII